MKIIPNDRRKRLFWLLLVVACVTVLPFLGLSDFHTKGEPREAVVAYSMLDTGNWILPRNNGGEIPYKPPFFHWIIAIFSAAAGGVSEFTSRLPSAVALIGMTIAVYLFYARRKAPVVALLTAFVCLTAFELHRGGANCRVDMMLTALTVVALIMLYRWYERGLKGVPWIAILLMSCGTLTKGPVGTLIPCLAFGVFLLLRGVNFFKAFFSLVAWGAMSLILPLCWYVAAYQQGGREFLDLVMEENFGRMTSTMSYESCVNPWYYNLVTLAGGYVPWILLVLLSVFSWKKIRSGTRGCSVPVWQRIKGADAVDTFSAVCVVVIFVFYCFPQSKRSVYLMPIYPFIAYFLARYVLWLSQVKSKALTAYGSVLAAVCMLLTFVFVALKCGCVPDLHLGDDDRTMAMIHELQQIGGFGWALVILPFVLSAVWFGMLAKGRLNGGRWGGAKVWGICALTFGLYMALDGTYQPAVLQAKSQRGIAIAIEQVAPASDGDIYEFLAAGEFAAGDPLHFFEINFYMHNRVHNFLRENPDRGYLLVTADDAAAFLPEFESRGYVFEPVYESERHVYGSPVMVCRFGMMQRDML